MTAALWFMLALQDLKEAEPNDSAETATALPLGRALQGRVTGSAEELDWYRVEIPARGAFRLLARPVDPAARPRVESKLELFSGSEEGAGDGLYVYWVDDDAPAFQFFPVLEPGVHFLKVGFLAESPAGGGYELSIAPAVDAPSAEELREARKAIDAGVAWLLSKAPEWTAQAPVLGAESIVLAALSEGADARARLERLDREYVEPLAKLFEETEGTWRGRKVRGVGDTQYAHAIATLGLAEAAAAGSGKARAAASRAAEYLLAAQQSERKCDAWGGPMRRTELAHGGWRYRPESRDADLSVTGWCLVGLVAAGAAGVEVEGLRDGVDRAADYTERLGSDSGFSYDDPGGTAGNVRNSVGALVSLLCARESGALESALADLDRHLPGGTQVDVGEDYLLYFAYYATRANYLRGGRAWERWRSAMIRQLLSHRRADGSWAAQDNESILGDRWATALGVMILRLCLNEAPAYLRLELRGF